jgi:hypothetical protein
MLCLVLLRRNLTPRREICGASQYTHMNLATIQHEALTRARCFFSKPFASEETDEKRCWVPKIVLAPANAERPKPNGGQTGGGSGKTPSGCLSVAKEEKEVGFLGEEKTTYTFSRHKSWHPTSRRGQRGEIRARVYLTRVWLAGRREKRKTLLLQCLRKRRD